MFDTLREAAQFAAENFNICILCFAGIGLNQQMLPVFLGLLFAAAVAWLFLSSRLYAELRQNYPGLYKKLGSPQFFMKKSITVNFKVIRFLLKQDHKTAVDSTVIRLCRGLRSLFYIYIICLTGSLILLFDIWGKIWFG
jgi:hypothetical protein